MLAYNMLGLQTWRVSSVGINFAYRKAAATSHPDKAAPREKELATLEMQQINAVRDMLLDNETRTQYHRDGVIPWVI
jgi:DnaJ-class molecular chaperone